MTDRVKIFDTTLRDGEQAPGCSMTLREKLRLSKALSDLRVDVIEALNMTVPGYYAHLSAMKDGETMKIPQYSLS